MVASKRAVRVEPAGFHSMERSTIDGVMAGLVPAIHVFAVTRR
jgi:hypothetical protein